VAYNRYVIGRITSTILYMAQNEKDQALGAYVQGAAWVLDGVLSAAQDDAVRLREAGVVALRQMLARIASHSQAGCRFH
jgi:hypothetical protein